MTPRILLIALRRSPARWAWLVVAALNLAFIFGRDTSWIGIWPRGSAAAQITAFYDGPLFAGLAALVAGREARSRVSERIATKRGPVRNAAMLIPTLCYATMAYSTGFVAVVFANLGPGPAGFIWPSYYLLGLAVIVACIGIGHIAGSFLYSSVGGPLAAVVISFVLVTSVGNSMHFVLLQGDAWLTVRATAVSSHLGIAAILLAVACLTPPRVAKLDRERVRAPRRRPHRAVAACVVALILIGAATALAGPVQVARTPPSRALCTAAGPTICLWPDDRVYLAEIRRMHDGMSHILPVFRVPAGLYEQGLDPGRLDPAQRHRNIQFSTAGGLLWAASNDIAISIGTSTFPALCVPDGAAAQAAFSQANFNILGYLIREVYGGPRPSNEGGGPPADPREIASVVASAQSAQLRWLHRQEKAFDAPPCHP